MEWKSLAFLAIGMVAGLLIGYQLNLEQEAKAMATGTCGTCQANVKTMVDNFNSLLRQCPSDGAVSNASYGWLNASNIR